MNKNLYNNPTTQVGVLNSCLEHWHPILLTDSQQVVDFEFKSRNLTLKSVNYMTFAVKI